MRRLLHTIVILASAAACACDDSRPASPAPPVDAGENITGRERIGWTQTAPHAQELASYAYAVYVDGARRLLEGYTCATASATTFDCAAPLPPLTPGTHTLELAAFMTTASGISESGRSAPLRVTVVGATAPAAEAVHGGVIQGADGLRLRADILARDLWDPVDLAAAPDGRLFVAERSRRVRIIAPDSAGMQQPLAPGIPQSLIGSDDVALLALALPPAFTTTHLIYIASVVEGRTGPLLLITRFRETGGAFGQAAVIASHPVAALDISATARFGPDGMLYLGIGTGADPRDAQNLSTTGGKILRIREDGTTPHDNPWSWPIFSLGHRDPRGLVWHPEDGLLWEVERDEEGDEVNWIRSGGNYGWPLVRRLEEHPGATPAAIVLPPGTEPSGITAVTSTSSPLYGELIVSASGGQDLLRLSRSGGGRWQPAGRLIQGRFGHLGQVTSGPDGAIYFVTANQHLWGAGQDMLIRLVPVEGDLRRANRQ